jgi:hypothetical protein
MGIQLYTNAVAGKHALDFFKEHAAGCPRAQLVCPFFTWTEPLKILSRAGVRDIQLLVRLCYATLPEALKEAECIPGVSIRYFANEALHAKLYILGDVAFIGSANLTIRGLQVNHEIGVTLYKTDPLFADLNDYFGSLWAKAFELTSPAFNRFLAWHEGCAGVMPTEYSEGAGDRPEPEMARAEDIKRTIPRHMFTDLCVDQLRRFGEPKTAKDIYVALLRRDYEIPFRKRKPYKRVYNALFLRERRTGNVFRSGERLWHLAEWYSTEEAERLKQKHKKADPEHIARTRRGIQEARLRGRQIGAVRKMTEEEIERAIQMTIDGATRVEVAAKFGVSTATIFNVFRWASQEKGMKYARLIRGRRGRGRSRTPSAPLTAASI